ncbi:hypothetical protein [Noviherbaspirillum pedocola]|uniref:Uncharacterized protein n=1 Tax=Noviherbaspirillum pedocola TaxID=2801341 RepID=A0A934SV51_9BURK|nr:hypothetical protein [Noviherbaspirillum pedocola]MBK4735995.1 hypothetical protein [Noviherbaspirillum pedocola]
MNRIATLVMFAVGMAAAAGCYAAAQTPLVPDFLQPFIEGAGIAILLTAGVVASALAARYWLIRRKPPTGFAAAIMVEADRLYRDHGYLAQGRFCAEYMATHFKVSTDIAKTALQRLARTGWLISSRQSWGMSYVLPVRRRRSLYVTFALASEWASAAGSEYAKPDAAHGNAARPQAIGVHPTAGH